MAHIGSQRQKLWMVDLCCGFKGASAPASDRGWRVTTLDLLPWLSPDVVGDLRRLPFKRGCAPDLLWISPDCSPYTRWFLPWFPKQAPDLGLMKAAAAARDWLAPRSWVIENVPAARTWVEPFLGPIAARTWGHVFWSDLACLVPQTSPRKEVITGNTKGSHQARSIIPYEVAHAFIVAAERRANQIGWSEVPL